jgi:hypothetical protein
VATKAAKAASSRRYYEKNREKVLARSRAFYEKNRDRVLETGDMSSVRAKAKELSEVRKDLVRARIRELKSLPCVDCKQCFPYFVMHFDHINDDKSFGISWAVHAGYSWRRISAEIAKCEVVCANCHAVRTFSRGQYESLE